MKRWTTNISSKSEWMMIHCRIGKKLLVCFSIAHGETLRFLLSAKVPLERFLFVMKLASRGYDKDFLWIGFDEAEKLWLK